MIIATVRDAHKTKERNVEGIASYRSARGFEVAARLDAVATANNATVASAVAFRLHRCADERNIWTAEDLHNNGGELYDGTGSLWSCGSRLCPSCCAVKARESRRDARAAIDRLNVIFDKKKQFKAGLRWRSLVLTMPLMKGADVTDSIKRINDAFRRLTNRPFWKALVRGGMKSVEFTVRPDGFHVHIHLLVLSKFMPVNAEREKKSHTQTGNLRAEMKHCLKAAGAFVNGLPVVAVYDVKRQGERHHNDQSISLERALLETCKYLTKSESWDEIPDHQLIKVAEVKRWPRMFEILGRARGASNKETKLEVEPEPREMESASDERAKHTLVHTPPLSNGQGAELSNGSRGESWRVLLARMPFDDWKRLMDGRITRAQKFRVEQLVEKFPFASFRTLKGKDFWTLSDRTEGFHPTLTTIFPATFPAALSLA